MKINEVVKQTGLSKRTIYYYIEEQLISPKINPDNGYYTFSEDDVIKLKTLQQLRKMDFSIKDIHSILSHPQSSHIYYQKQIEKLEKEQALLNAKLKHLQVLQKSLPLVVTYESLSNLMEEHVFEKKSGTSYFRNPASDAKLVSLYLWGSFLQGVPMTEYRQYLWEKILAATTASDDPSLIIIKNFLYSLPAEQIDAEFAERNLHIETIVSLTKETMDAYVQRTVDTLKKTITDDKYLKFWKDYYHSRFQPSTKLFDSDINTLVRELSPRFSLYYKNIHIYCDRIYNWLHSNTGDVTRQKIMESLSGYIDIHADHHGQLVALLSLPGFYDKLL